MRLIFEKGKQRELIEREKGNFSYAQFSKMLGLKESRLKSYFYEESSLPSELFLRLKHHKEFERFILEKRGDSWGQSKGGKISVGSTKEISIPKESEDLAEFYGIMLGDGNSNSTKGHKIGTYMIRIVGHSELDKEYLMHYVKPLIERLFDIKVKDGKFKSANAMFLQAHSLKLVEFLNEKGFIPGDKMKNQLGIPNWIQKDDGRLKACLRGLYDTDGSAYKLTNQNSYQINFCGKNQILLRDVREALLSLGINASKVSKEKDIYITKKEELRKFLKLVGFHNPKHLNKIKMWNIAPSSSGQILKVN